MFELSKDDCKKMYNFLKINKKTHCQKSIYGNGVCGVKLDCHLHDWRQKDQIILEKERIKREIEKLPVYMRVAGGDLVEPKEAILKEEVLKFL